jgi:uncharacterized protein YkwD
VWDLGGRKCKAVLEGHGGGRQVPLEVIHKDWMNSKVHRDNILAERFKEVGLGLAAGSRGDVYFTQVFGTHRRRP